MNYITMIINAVKKLLRSLLRFGLFVVYFAGLLVGDACRVIRDRVRLAREWVASDAAEAQLRVRAVGRLRGGRGGSRAQRGGLGSSMGLPAPDFDQNGRSYVVGELNNLQEVRGE